MDISCVCIFSKKACRVPVISGEDTKKEEKQNFRILVATIL
jgi:hypothetical protein